jgi:DNA polymerase elongation subunit (family B)
MKTQFIPIDYDSFDFEGKNYVKIVGRDSKGKKVCVIDSCDIYFWAILEDNVKEKKINEIIKKLSKIKLKTKGRETRVEKIELHNKNFLGKKVKALKVFATNYKDLHEIAEHFVIKEVRKRRGYDLGFITHYILEKKINPLEWYELEGEVLDGSMEFGGIDKALDVDYCVKLEKHVKTKNNFKPHALAYDIETDELKIGEGAILMISLVSEGFKKVITWKKEVDKKKYNYVEYVKDEKELLERFLDYTHKIAPDFLVGYFSDGFDLPYLKARAEKNKVKLSLGIDGSQPIFSRGISNTAKIKGIVHIDLLKFIRTAYAQYMQSETLSLNEVAKEFLGDNKKPFKFQHSSSKSLDWGKFYEYNLHDSVLTFQLFEKFWPDLLEFSKIIKQPVFETSRAGLSKFVESYILSKLENYNEIPERRPGHDQIGERRYQGPVEGAFVLEPSPGLYEDVVFFDFTSMHTSIIITMNISKSTLLEGNPKDANTIKTSLGKFSFSKKPGFLPLMLKEIFDTRKKFKAEYTKNPDNITKARSNAFKVLSASVHGYMAFFGARYYSKESSAAILAYVRKFDQDTIKEIEKKGHKVIMGDTDSIAFLMEGKTKSQIKAILKELNSKLPGIMELELEGFFKRGLWVTTRGGKTGAKKKYALIDKDGNLKIRGFETVRRDWCALAREVQDKIIRKILKEGNEKEALEYLKEVVKKVKKRKIPIEDLIIKTQLKKPLAEYKNISPHVIAARRMKEMKIPISQGNLIKYYIAELENGEKSKLVRDRVKLPEEKGEYNIQYYIDNQIIPAVENIFQVFGIEINDIVNSKPQKTLNDF